ncbi:hypothetical protein DM611_05225 [Stenotrophomonas maltophilia]|nr:hypothetical protein DM611_05225 [Stenotrophomonas maltophilia]MBA0360446.1 hypothetical protein [Stenotrophomonas maltophilia]
MAWMYCSTSADANRLLVDANRLLVGANRLLVSANRFLVGANLGSHHDAVSAAASTHGVDLL